MADPKPAGTLPLLDEPTAPADGLRPAEQLPEPARFWIRYAPRPRVLKRHWPHPSGPWLDLARGRLQGLEPVDDTAESDVPTMIDPAGELLDDVLYLPPVHLSRGADRDQVAARHGDRGTPVLVQLSIQDVAEGSVGELPPGIHRIVDPTPVLLGSGGEADREILDRVPAGSVVAWPLVPGLTDDPDDVDDACRRLAAAGVTTLQGVVPDLSPADKRHLMERSGDDLFDALFHRDPPKLRDLARIAASHGLAPFLVRPLPRRPMLGIGNRRLAGRIALAAELEDRLGRSPERVQSLYRSAREADRTPYDLEALAREGNLGVLDWLSPEAREIVDESLETPDADAPQRTDRIDRLLEEYLR